MRVFTTTTAAAQKLKLDYKKWATENNPPKAQSRLFGVWAVCGCRLGKNELCNTIYDDEGEAGEGFVESAIIDVRGVYLAARKKKTPSKKGGSGKDGPKKDPWR